MPDPLNMPERAAMRQALKAAKADQRKPTDDDRPPLETFPSTRASRAALELRRNQGKCV
jgi:hypothetical protein